MKLRFSYGCTLEVRNTNKNEYSVSLYYPAQGTVLRGELTEEDIKREAIEFARKHFQQVLEDMKQ